MVYTKQPAPSASPSFCCTRGKRTARNQPLPPPPPLPHQPRVRISQWLRWQDTKKPKRKEKPKGEKKKKGQLLRALSPKGRENSLQMDETWKGFPRTLNPSPCCAEQPQQLLLALARSVETRNIIVFKQALHECREDEPQMARRRLLSWWKGQARKPVCYQRPASLGLSCLAHSWRPFGAEQRAQGVSLLCLCGTKQTRWALSFWLLRQHLLPTQNLPMIPYCRAQYQQNSTQSLWLANQSQLIN